MMSSALRRWLLGGILALAAAVLVGCGVNIARFELRFSLVDETSDSGITVSSTVVVRDSLHWTSLWRDHTGGLLPAPPLPYIDFDRNIVVGIFLGQRPDRCRHARVERVILVDEGRLLVRWREETSGSCASGLSWPGAIVRIPFPDLPVRFEQL